MSYALDVYHKAAPMTRRKNLITDQIKLNKKQKLASVSITAAMRT